MLIPLMFKLKPNAVERWPEMYTNGRASLEIANTANVEDAYTNHLGYSPGNWIAHLGSNTLVQVEGIDFTNPKQPFVRVGLVFDIDGQPKYRIQESGTGKGEEFHPLIVTEWVERELINGKLSPIT